MDSILRWIKTVTEPSDVFVLILKWFLVDFMHGRVLDVGNSLVLIVALVMYIIACKYVF